MVTYVQQEVYNEPVLGDYRYNLNTLGLAQRVVDLGGFINHLGGSVIDFPGCSDAWDLSKMDRLISILDNDLSYFRNYEINLGDGRRDLIFRKDNEDHWIIFSNNLPEVNLTKVDKPCLDNITTTFDLLMCLQSSELHFNQVGELVDKKIVLTHPIRSTLHEMLEDLKYLNPGTVYYIHTTTDVFVINKATPDLWFVTNVHEAYFPKG